MKNSPKKKKYLFLISLILFVLNIFFFASNLRTLEILKEKPLDIQVVNISPSDAWVYWKAPENGSHRFFYKKVSDTKEPYIPVFTKISKDEVQEKRIFYVHLNNLDPHSEYSLQIASENHLWDQGITFRTKDIAQEVQLPEIVTGEGNQMSFLLLDVQGEKYMVDTQYHGTYAFDSKGKESSVTQYSTYITGKQLKEKLAQYLSSSVYASTGANCKTNIQVNTSGFVPSKAKVIDVTDRWTARCLLGGYPETCYEDVYCKGLSLGVNPAFLITIWAHESGGSNYANLSTVEDFGIHGLPSVPVANFTKQIEHFIAVQAQPSYIANCQWTRPDNPSESEKNIIKWGMRYKTGKCTTADISAGDPCDLACYLNKGQEYMDGIRLNYKWFAGSSAELTWPFIRTKDTTTCNYSGSVTNTAYNSCTEKGTENPNPDPDPDPDPNPGVTCTGPDNKPGKEDILVGQTCEDVGGCECFRGSIKQENYFKDVSCGIKCTDENPNPDPDPDPVVSCTGPDNKPGKEDILVGQTCEDVGGCECFRGSIKQENYFKDVSCGIKCTDENPNPDPDPDPVVSCTGPDNKPGKEDILVGQTCEDVGGCECFRGSIKVENYFKDVSCGIKCTDENPNPVESKCCLSNQEVTWMDPNKCGGKVLEGITRYECSPRNININIKQGINFLQSYEVINNQDVTIGTAKELIEYTGRKVFVVGEFLNNEWTKVVTYSNGSIKGSDFNLEVGKIYLVISTEEFEIPIQSITVPLVKQDLTKLVGWNLVPTKYFENQARYTTDILTNEEFAYISQVALWDNELSSFKYTIEDLTVLEGTDEMFGTYHDITTQQGIFVRISE